MASNNVRVKVWVQKFADRPYLMLQWHDPDTGRRKSKSSGTDNAEMADQLARDLEYELNHGIRRQPSNLTWARFCEMYAEEKLAGNRKATAK